MFSFRNCSIKTALFILFFLPVILLITCIALGLFKLHRAEISALEATDVAMPNLVSMYEIKTMFKDVRLVNTKISNAKTESDRAKLYEELKSKTADIVASLNDLEQKLTSAEQRSIVDKLESDVKDYLTLSLQKDAIKDDPAKLAEFVKTKTTPKGVDIDNGIQSFIAFLNDYTGKISSNVTKETAPGFLIFASIFVIVLSLLFFYVAYLSIAVRIHKIGHYADLLAKGEIAKLKTRHDAGHSNNEITNLFSSFDQIIDLTKDTVTGLRDDSHELYDYVDKMNLAQKDISESASELLTQSMNVNASIEEMASSAREISDNCSQLSVSAEAVNSETNEGMQVVSSTIESIKHHSRQTKEDAKSVFELGEKTEHINSIISTIQNIADQTNLLALNAAIEAARAGEHGRGFAVVADEVRTLAQKTSVSTQEITRMVVELQSGAKNANLSISNTVEKMENLANDTGLLQDTFSKIMNDVRIVSEQVAHITAATEQQTSAANEMTRNMNGMVDQINHMSADTAKTLESTEYLSDKVHELVDKQISKFSV